MNIYQCMNEGQYYCNGSARGMGSRGNIIKKGGYVLFIWGVRICVCIGVPDSGSNC